MLPPVDPRYLAPQAKILPEMTLNNYENSLNYGLQPIYQPQPFQSRTNKQSPNMMGLLQTGSATPLPEYDMNRLMPDGLNDSPYIPIPLNSVVGPELGNKPLSNTPIETIKPGLLDYKTVGPADGTAPLSNTPIGTIKPGVLSYKNGMPPIDQRMPPIPPYNIPTEDGTGGEDGGEFDPERYYMFKGALDSSALFNNMVQETPPPMQFALTKSPRIRQDRTELVNAQEQIKQQTGAMARGMREGMSQASSLMTGYNALASQMGQNLGQVGIAGAQQALQVEQQNQNIAAQEEQQNAGIINQEMATNYQIQQQAQIAKNAAVSNQLARVGDTAGAYAQYKAMKTQSDKIEEHSKTQSNLTNDIQLQMLKYQETQNALSSSNYSEAEDGAVMQHFKDTQESLYNDPKYSALREAFGDNYEPTKISEREAKFKSYESNWNQNLAVWGNFLAPPAQGQMNDEQYQNILGQYEAAKASYEKSKPEYDKLVALHKQDKEFYQQLKGSFDTTGTRENFQSNYLKERGLPSSSEYVQSLVTLIESARQL